MSLHTPGPWVADDFCMQDDRQVRVGTTDGTKHYYHTSATICECAVSDEDGDGEPSVAVAEANARLIARAPAMDNALRNCLLFAMRQSRKRNTGGWEQVIRFCKEGGVEPSPLRAGMETAAKGSSALEVKP